MGSATGVSVRVIPGPPHWALFGAKSSEERGESGLLRWHDWAPEVSHYFRYGLPGISQKILELGPIL